MDVSAANGTLLVASLSRSRPGNGTTLALTRRAFADARVRTIAFAYLFALYAYIQPAGYRHTYPTTTDRLSFARSFGPNKALRLLYGEPHDLLTVSGYTAWRVGGTLAILAAVFGLLASVRALRTEEDTGRMELVLAGTVGRRMSFLTAIAAIAAGVLLLWAGEFTGFLISGLPVGGAAYLALATVSVAAVFVGVGALSSQLAPTRRLALELGAAVLVLMFLLRVIADTAAGAGWLRWITPLGWSEQLRPFAGPHPLVLLLPAAASVLLLALSAQIALRRDIGTGTLPARNSAAPRLGLLSSATAQALRLERTSLLLWASGVGVFALVLGVISKSVSSTGIPPGVRRELAKLGSGSIATPTGYLAFVFVFFVLAVSLFACAQIAAARHEEADGRLETLLGLPVARSRWLGGRLGLAAAGACLISLIAGVMSWIGAVTVGIHVALPRMLEAGANCLPVALLFLGIGALSYGIVPRASAAIAYGLLTLAFLWQLVGALLGVPDWLVNVTPFAHVGLVPTQPFRTGAATVMLIVAAGCALIAIRAFKRRDLIGE